MRKRPADTGYVTVDQSFLQENDDVREEEVKQIDTEDAAAVEAAKDNRPGIPEEPVKERKERGFKFKKNRDGEKQDDDGDDLTAKILKIEKKQLFYSRLAAGFTCGMFLVMLYIAISLVPRAVSTLENANDALDSVHGTIAEAQNTLGDINAMSKSLTKTSDAMNDLIVNNAGTLTESVEKLSDLDIDGLNQGIQDLQDALGPLAETMRNMSKFSLFGR